MAKEVKKEVIEEVEAVEVNEAEKTAEPEKKEEKKTWKQKRAEKKAQFKKDHPVAAKRVEVAKTVTLGAVAGFLTKMSIDLISNAIAGRNSGSGSSDVIDTQYHEVTNNDSNNN